LAQVDISNPSHYFGHGDEDNATVEADELINI
jgi:hypothetical protein